MIAADRNLSGKELLRRLIGDYVRHHTGKIAFAVFCMTLAAAATAANAWMLQPVLDDVFIKRDQTMLALLPWAVLAVALINGGAHYGHTVIMRYVGQRIISDMQQKLFAHLMRSDLGLFHEQAAGRLISRFTNDIMMLRASVSTLLTALAKESLTLVFLTGVMLYQNLTLSFIALIVFPVAIFPVMRLGKRMRKLSDSTQHQLGEFTARLDEVFQGVRTVKAYNREDYEIARAGGIIESLFALYFKAARVQAAASPLMEITSGVAIAGVIYYGGWQVMEGQTTAGAFFSFVAALIMAYKPAKSLAGLNATLQEGLAAANRLFKVFDSEPTVRDRPGAGTLAIREGAIRFERVTFRYGLGMAGVEEVTIDVPAGKRVALVGLSGGGKSTLFNLLLRFYDVEAGRITIDGTDVRDVTLASLRDSIAFVPQEIMLFDETVRANIAYGRENASEKEVFAAAKAAAADEFIHRLPEGYDTMIGPHGVKLSGGQRQRIAIARAMLRNAPILMLDEATSSLDNESERAVQQALGLLMQGRTTLIIAHRLSTVMHADIIYVIDAGRVIEQGTHTELLARGGRYHQLYSQHFAESQASCGP